MRSFWITFAATVLGLAAFGLASLITSFRYPALIIVWVAAYVAALILAIVLAVRRRSRVAAAVFAGIAASLLVLMVSCFALVITGA